ncbi:MAG: ferrochelatase [Nitrospirae bacterium]|nr:ferrochelatase [Nitrospirota bacterium]
MMIAVILLNMGAPDSLKAVKPFLKNLFSDREIIRLGPAFLQKPLASIIINARLKKTIEAYRLIGGRSPLNEITAAQAKALDESLNGSRFTVHGSRFFKVYVGMRYWKPFIEDAVEQIRRDGAKKIIAISLYPHYSAATTGSSINAFKMALMTILRQQKANCISNCDEKSCCILCEPVTAHCITSWFDNPIYIDAVIEKIKQGLEDLKTQGSSKPVVLFSAHSLPQRFIDEGDPYAKEVKGTVEAITKKLDINWRLSYQSKTGPVKWLKPTTEETIRRLSREGVKDILVVPISFVSDHIETLYEIDILYKDMAQRLGMNLKRIESLNTSPKFIEAMADMVMTNAAKSGWL